MNIKSYIDKDGKKKYKFNAYLGIDPLTGKEKRTNRRGFTSERQAKIEYAKLMSGLKEVKTRHHTIQSVYDEWIEIYRNTVKESTFKRTLDIFRLHILNEFGEVFVDKINVKMVQSWVNKKSKQITKYKEYCGYLKKLINYAISRNYAKENPCNYIIFPTKEVKKKKKIDYIWTVDELMQFLEYVKKERSLLWYAFFRLLAFSGMRRGEILALEWNDLDFTNNMLKISKSRKYTTNGEVTGSTKTNKSRDISIDKTTMSILHSWRKEQFRLIGRCELMFSKLDKSYIGLNYPIKVLDSITKKYHMTKIDIHRFRHMHTTMLMQANQSEGSLPAIMDRLGHSDITTTLNIYNHVMEKDKVNILDNLIENIK